MVKSASEEFESDELEMLEHGTLLRFWQFAGAWLYQTVFLQRS